MLYMNGSHGMKASHNHVSRQTDIHRHSHIHTCCPSRCFMPSVPQIAKRVLVTALLALASLLDVSLDATRDSSDDDVRSAYGSILRRASRAHVATSELRLAKEQWEQVLAAKARPRRPQAETKAFPICCAAVLLTYQSITGLPPWRRFLLFAHQNLAAWSVKHWRATCETCKKGQLHVHLMLQFHKKRHTYSRAFTFEGIPPNASNNDYLNEGMDRRNPQQSIDRGFFYVFANKKGTARDEANEERVAGNYLPAWVDAADVFTYRVLAKWIDTLWRRYKLEDAVHEQYIYAAREGVQARKRNLDACKSWKEAQDEEAELTAVVKRIRGNAEVYQPFPEVPAVTEWLRTFASDLLRYPLLILLGASASGKTEFAKSLFKQPLELKVGSTEVFPSKMVEFKRGFHDAIILDDARDLQFLVLHQEKLQGKHDGRIEFATTRGGTCFYTKYLFQIPTVVTANFTTSNLNFLEDNDWLNKIQNRVVVQWPPA